jgi:hypothetical protein
MAQNAEGAADNHSPPLAQAIRRDTERPEHFSNLTSVVDFLLLDLANPVSLGGVGDGSPVAAIRQCGGQFPGVSKLEDQDQLPPALGFVRFHHLFFLHASAGFCRSAPIALLDGLLQLWTSQLDVVFNLHRS